MSSRSSKGQAIAEGAAATVLIIAIVIGGVMMITGIGMYMLYQMKIQFVAQQGAVTALNDTEWLGAVRTPPSGTPTVQQQVNDAVNNGLTTMGLPAMTTDVPIVVNTVDSTRTYTVTVTCSGLKIISGGFLPSSLGTITGTATASNGNQTPPAALWMHTQANTAGGGYAGGGILLPAYSGGTVGFTAPGSSISSPAPNPLPPAGQQFEWINTTGNDGIILGF